MVSVEGSLDGVLFRAPLAPDGHGSHWLQVDSALREAPGAEIGALAKVELAPVADEPEPQVPEDLRVALDHDPAARATWDNITAMARRDWIFWIGSGKKAETRGKRIVGVCCFDHRGR